MSDDEAPQFPQYTAPTGVPTFAHPKQSAPLLKMMKHMLKLPKKKVLQRRNRVSRKKYTIV